MAIPVWLATAIKYGLPIASGIAAGNRQRQASAQFPALSYAEATNQAKDMLNPLYDEQLERTLKQLDTANIARGFYGQLPADVMKRSTAAEIERGRAGQIASLAQQMVGQSQQQAFQQQQLAAQKALNKGSQWQNMLMGLLRTYGSWMQGTERDPFDPMSAFSPSVTTRDVKASSNAITSAPTINPNANLSTNQPHTGVFLGQISSPNPISGNVPAYQQNSPYKLTPKTQNWQQPW